MGFVSDAVGGLLGSGADAAKDAAAAQGAGIQQGVDVLKPFVERDIDKTREFKAVKQQLQITRPAITSTQRQAGRISRFASRPEQQRKFIEDNPFF